MSIFDEFAADAALIFAEAGRIVTFRGEAVSAMIPQTEASIDLQTGGFVQSGNLTVRLLAAPYAAHPIAEGERLTYDGITYRISAITRRPPGAVTECRCEPLSAR